MGLLKLLLFISLPGFSANLTDKKTIEKYILARTVKIVTHDTSGLSSGSGISIGNRLILSVNHVLAYNDVKVILNS